VAPIAHTHKYYIDFKDIDPIETKYVIKKDKDIMDASNTQDIIFARGIMFCTDSNDLSNYIGNILIKYCIEKHDKRYLDMYVLPDDPFSELGAIFSTVQQLIILLYYYDIYDDKDKVNDSLVFQYVEMIRQFMYAYVIKYMAPNKVDVHTIMQYYDTLRILNDPIVPINLYNQIQPHLIKHKDKIITNMFK
jgi:hypothetical protein